jgi:gag-polypeptide of LTR copia-type/Zinc knuckle
MRAKDPMEIWATLRRVHQAAGFATSLALRRQFLTAKMEHLEHMQAWIGRIRTLAFCLEQANIIVPEQDIILALTMGLPPSYNAVIINFDSTPTEQLTLNHVIARLLNEETRQASRTLDLDETPTDNVAMAFTSSRRNAARTSRAAPSDITCFFCDGKGHIKSECPEKIEWEKSRAKKHERSHAALAIGLDSLDDEAF